MRSSSLSLKLCTNAAICQTRRLREFISNLVSPLSCPLKSSSGFSLSKIFAIGTIQGETCCGVAFLYHCQLNADNDTERHSTTAALFGGLNETVNETVNGTIKAPILFPCSKAG